MAALEAGDAVSAADILAAEAPIDNHYVLFLFTMVPVGIADSRLYTALYVFQP